MHNELLEYVSDETNDLKNFNLALQYENQKHYSPACSFYLRCAELTKNNTLAYECLLRLYFCFMHLSNRDYTCENLLKSALFLMPNRPEAYFLLSQFYERKNNWMDSYVYASLGLSVADGKPSDLKKDVGYVGKYALTFQKAVSAWWYGKPSESRMLFHQLSNENLNDYYYDMVQNNISRLGSGPESQSSVMYDKSKHDLLRFKFKNSKNIEKNFSQAYQDMFVLTMLDGKQNGSYLEIGSAHAFHNSNTALLESLGWTGIGIEINKDLVDQHRQRKNKVFHTNALKVNYSKLLEDNFDSKIIDYLQLDIEPSKNTFEALLSIPFEKYKFRVITYEHDHYVDLSKSYRDKSRKYLQNIGYTLIVNDVSPTENANFEDWWVNKDLIDPEIFDKVINAPHKDINKIDLFMLNIMSK